MLIERKTRGLEGARLGCPRDWEQLVLGEPSYRSGNSCCCIGKDQSLHRATYATGTANAGSL